MPEVDLVLPVAGPGLPSVCKAYMDLKIIPFLPPKKQPETDITQHQVWMADPRLGPASETAEEKAQSFKQFLRERKKEIFLLHIGISHTRNICKPYRIELAKFKLFLIMLLVLQDILFLEVFLISIGFLIKNKFLSLPN